MKNILFKTSKGIAKAVIVSSEDDLHDLMDNDALFNYTEECDSGRLFYQFHSWPHEFFGIVGLHPQLVMIYKESIPLFENYNISHFFFEDGWVKMELDDPHYGCPEWEPILIADYPFVFNDIEEPVVKTKKGVLALFDNEQ